MKNEQIELNKANDYGQMLQLGSHYDHVHSVEESRIFIRKYGEAIYKKANTMVYVLIAVIVVLFMIIAVLFVAYIEFDYLDESGFGALFFVIDCVITFLAVRGDVNGKRKKIGKSFSSLKVLDGLTDEEIIDRTNKVIDLYNAEYQSGTWNDESTVTAPNHNRLDEKNGDVQNMSYYENDRSDQQILLVNGIPAASDDGSSFTGKRSQKADPTFRAGRTGLLIGVIAAVLLLGAVILFPNAFGNGNASEDLYHNTSYYSNSEEEEEPVPVSDDYDKALETAEEYAQLYMSKNMIYDKLVNGLGEMFTGEMRFTEEAAQYAVDHLEWDWNENAVMSAKAINTYMYYSEANMRDELLIEGGFTEESVNYAIEHAEIDWNENALEKAKRYQRLFLDNDDIYEMLTNELEQFTPEQAQYAVDHLDHEDD